MTRRNPTPRGVLREAKANAARIRDTQVQFNRTMVDFIKADLQTALTFSGIALQSKDDDDKRRRNHANARRGHDTIVKFLKTVTLSAKDTRYVSRNLRRLKSELKELGATL